MHMQRTLQIMQQLGQDFREEWHMYGDEASVARSVSALPLPGYDAPSGTVVRRRAVAKAAPAPAAQETGTPIVGDIFNDNMRPGEATTTGQRARSRGRAAGSWLADMPLPSRGLAASRPRAALQACCAVPACCAHACAAGPGRRQRGGPLNCCCL